MNEEDKAKPELCAAGCLAAGRDPSDVSPARLADRVIITKLKTFIESKYYDACKYSGESPFLKGMKSAHDASLRYLEALEADAKGPEVP